MLDELGYLSTESAFGPALYELIAGCYERPPTIITSNKSLTEWAQIVQDVSLAAAIVDRLLHHGQVLYLKGASWRVRGRAPDGTSESEASAFTHADERGGAGGGSSHSAYRRGRTSASVQQP